MDAPRGLQPGTSFRSFEDIERSASCGDRRMNERPSGAGDAPDAGRPRAAHGGADAARPRRPVRGRPQRRLHSAAPGLTLKVVAGTLWNSGRCRWT